MGADVGHAIPPRWNNLGVINERLRYSIGPSCKKNEA